MSRDRYYYRRAELQFFSREPEKLGLCGNAARGDSADCRRGHVYRDDLYVDLLQLPPPYGTDYRLAHGILYLDRDQQHRPHQIEKAPDLIPDDLGRFLRRAFFYPDDPLLRGNCGLTAKNPLVKNVKN